MKNNQSGMSLIVKTVTRLTAGLILIYGIYIVLNGHSIPGGGFAGGVILALSFVQIMLSFGKDAVLKKLSQKRDLTLASVGALVFLFLATLNFMQNNYLKEHYNISNAGLASFCDVAIALMVACGFFAIFLALVLFISKRERR